MDEVQSRRLSLIDVSCEDDSLIDSFTGDFNFPDDHENKNLELFGGVAANKLEVVHEDLELGDQVIQPSQSMEPEMKKKSGKYNLRKSLAWDSAFFTSAGVLDPEELSSMMDGDKTEKGMLPAIQEEICRSTDTNSTLESDTLTLESIETNLFEDVRASIQKSSKASNVVDGSTKEGSEAKENGFARAPKGMDFSSQEKAIPKFASKKPSIDVQRPGMLRRQAIRCAQVSQSVSTSGESTKPFLKRPKVLANPIPSSAALNKRASTGGTLIKTEKDNVRSSTGRGAPMPKIPLGSRIVPKPRQLSKSSSGASRAIHREVGSSAFDSSSGTASSNIAKSPLNSKRKTDSGTDNPPSSGSTFKTAPRIPPRNKIESGKSHLSSNKIPGTKLLSSISPASSVSEWSSESSRASLDTISLKSGSVDFDAHESLDFQNHVTDVSSVGHETQVTGLLHKSVVKAHSERNGALPPSSKPSGLRLPSPKIGFFDGVKSTGSTPNGTKQSHSLVPSSSPNAGRGSVSLSGDLRKGKLQPARTINKPGNRKTDTPQTASNIKSRSPIPLQQSVNAVKVFTPSRNSKSPQVENKVPSKSVIDNQWRDEKLGIEGYGIDVNEIEKCFRETNGSISPKVDSKVPPESVIGNQLKDEIGTKGQSTDINEQVSCFVGRNYRVDLSKDEVTPELKDPSHVKAAKVTPIIEDPLSTTDAENIFTSEIVGGAAACELHNLKHISDCLNDVQKREESQFVDEVDALSRQVGAIDIGAESQQVLVGESLPSTEFQQ